MRLSLLLVLVLVALAGPAGAQDGWAAADDEPHPRPFLGTDLGLVGPPAWEPERSAGDPAFGVLRLAGDAGALPKAFAIHAGFPYVEADFCLALTSAADLRAGFRTAYGGMAQVEAGGRARLIHLAPLRVLLRAALAYSVFRPDQAAMWMTGTRGFALHPGLIVSAAVGETLVFLDLGSQFILDLDPASPPLGGARPPIDLLLTINVHLGVELPLTSNIAFIGKAGVDVFPGTRAMGEPPALPRFSAGLSFAP